MATRIFWPKVDHRRILDLFVAIEPLVVSPSTGYIRRVIDPQVRFKEPSPTDDPTQPAMFAAWRIPTHDIVSTMKKDQTGPREITIGVQVHTQVQGFEAGVSGKALDLADEFDKHMQSDPISGLTYLPHVMRYLEGPFGSGFDNFQLSIMTAGFHSEGSGP